MSIELDTPPIAPRIAALLDGLRLRIRGYVWTEGLAAMVVLLGLAFWFTLAFDWLFEPPWQFRAAMLAIVAAGLAYVVQRYLLRRAFRPLADTNLAALLERRFRDYRDSLITTVELGTHPAHAAGFNPDMLNHTRRQAVEQSQHVQLSDLFRFAPLLHTLGFAAALAVSVLAFAVLAHEAFATWVNRVVLLDQDLLWPRANHVRVQGFPDNRTLKVAKGSDFEITAAADLTGQFTLPELVQVRYRTDEGIRGRDNMSSIGTAGGQDREQKYSYVFKGVMSSIGFDVYGGDDRDRGYRIEVVDNPTISRMELACKYPEYTGRPASTLPASAVVQLPQGTKVGIHCETNKDLVEVVVNIVQGDKSATLAEVKLPADGDRRHCSVEVPELMEDTTLLFELHDADGISSREPVRLVLAARPDDVPAVTLRLRGISTAITPQARLPVVGDARDDYGLARLWFEYLLDKTGPVDKTRVGIATPPTPSVPGSAGGSSAQPSIQPFHTVTVDPNGRPLTQVNVEPGNDESLDLKRLADVAELLQRRGVKAPDDLSRIASPDEIVLLRGITTQQDLDRALAFAPKVGQRLFVTLKAADNCALPAGANVGQGERYQLDVVPPEQLLSMLEGRELMLRRRFEIIYQELADTRDALAHVDFAPSVAKKSADAKTGSEPGAEPGDPSADDARHKPGAESGDTPPDRASGAPVDAAQETPQQRTEWLAKRAWELRDLRVNRALDNSDRSAHETLTVAESFDDIREEMSNNRVDTPELQSRLKDQIADPLRRISRQMFPELRTRLVRLRQVLDDPAAGPARLQSALEQTDAILVEMKLVLDKMLELETFNEVVEILRDIITSQEKLNQQTLERQKEELKNKLRDLKN